MASTAENSRALVVEGGAMRGIFASGVLDGFLDNNYLDFDFCDWCICKGATNLIGSCVKICMVEVIKSLPSIPRDPEFINFSRFTGDGAHLTGY